MRGPSRAIFRLARDNVVQNAKNKTAPEGQGEPRPGGMWTPSTGLTVSSVLHGNANSAAVPGRLGTQGLSWNF